MPGSQVTDFSISESYLCSAKLQCIKCIWADLEKKPKPQVKSLTSAEKRTCQITALWPRAFHSFPYWSYWRWADLVLELAPEPTPPKLLDSPGTFQMPNIFTEKAPNLLLCKGELGIIRLIIIKLDLPPCFRSQSGLSCDKFFPGFISHSSTVSAAQQLGEAKPGCWPGEGTGRVIAALRSQVAERGEERVQRICSGKNLVSSFKQQKS